MTTMTVNPTAPPSVPYAAPLAMEQVEAMALAKKRGKKVRRAQIVALTDAWMTAVFAGVAGLSGVLDLSGLLVGLAMGVVAWNSFRGARRLKALDPLAGRFLGYNQLLLMGIITVYCLLQLWAAHRAPGLMAQAGVSDPQTAQMLGETFGGMDRLYWYLALAIYSAVIVGTMMAQGLTAIYYFTRGRVIRAYCAETPEWVVALQRSGTLG